MTKAEAAPPPTPPRRLQQAAGLDNETITSSPDMKPSSVVQSLTKTGEITSPPTDYDRANSYLDLIES